MQSTRPFGAIALATALTLGACGAASERVSEAGDRATELTNGVAAAAIHAVNLDERGRALRGYDPVAYFTDGEAVPGKSELSLEWNDATWYFANEANRDAFEQDAEKYAPANGGFCTFGVVLAKKFDGDPEVWSIRDDRLYVFLNEDVKVKFLQDTTGNLEKVATNWPVIADKPADSL